MVIATNRTRSRYVVRSDKHPNHSTSLGGEVVNDYTEGSLSLPNHLFAEFPSFLRYERISDVAGKRRDRSGRFDSSNVERLVIKAQLKDVPSYRQNYGWSTADSNVKRFDTWLTPELFDAHMPTIPDSLWRSSANEAFNSFATQIPEMISLANFGWELREISSLIPKLEKSISKTAASGYLNYNFGWKPFIGDLNTLFTLCSTLDSKIQYLRDTWGKETRLGMFRPNVNDVNLSSFDFDYQAFDIVKFHYRLTDYRCDFRAGGYLFHQLKGLNDLSGYIRALIVSLGLDNPLKVIWNALPYSFVVDWFTGLSARLQTLSINPFKGTWIVNRRSASMKESAVWDVSVEFTGNVMAPLLGTDNPLGTVKVERYGRIASLPVSSDFLSELLTQTPTPKQQSLLIAMLL